MSRKSGAIQRSQALHSRHIQVKQHHRWRKGLYQPNNFGTTASHPNNNVILARQNDIQKRSHTRVVVSKQAPLYGLLISIPATKFGCPPHMTFLNCVRLRELLFRQCSLRLSTVDSLLSFAGIENRLIIIYGRHRKA